MTSVFIPFCDYSIKIVNYKEVITMRNLLNAVVEAATQTLKNATSECVKYASEVTFPTSSISDAEKALFIETISKTRTSSPVYEIGSKTTTVRAARKAARKASARAAEEGRQIAFKERESLKNHMAGLPSLTIAEISGVSVSVSGSVSVSAVSGSFDKAIKLAKLIDAPAASPAVKTIHERRVERKIAMEAMKNSIKRMEELVANKKALEALKFAAIAAKTNVIEEFDVVCNAISLIAERLTGLKRTQGKAYAQLMELCSIDGLILRNFI
jgi:hypothetical protein